MPTCWTGCRSSTIRQPTVLIRDGKISIEEGPAITLTPPQFGLQGATWGDGVIVFASARSGGLFRVPDTGGEPERRTSTDEKRGEAAHAWPHLLPGSQAVLFPREIRNQETLRSETVLLDLRRTRAACPCFRR